MKAGAGAVALAAALLLPACSTDLPGREAARPTPSPSATPIPSETPTPTPTPGPAYSDWVVGASPLPLRDDGFGQVRPTPRTLRVRLLPTPDRLPPPDPVRFTAEIAPVTAALVRRTDLAWRPGCPVDLGDLRILRVGFWGFDDLPHTGELVVNTSVARDVVSVFHRLWDARFPLEDVRLVTQAVNPFQNPYQRGDLVLPELASAYLDRDWRRPGMIEPAGVVVRAFSAIGWTWGGTFTSVLDLHHFSATGR